VAELDVEPGELAWRKSSYSGNNGCVEIAPLPRGYVALRDSKNPGRGFLVYDAHEWTSFLKGVRSGEFDDVIVDG
jgi:Domain of unknown function (DUF397)